MSAIKHAVSARLGKARKSGCRPEILDGIPQRRHDLRMDRELNLSSSNQSTTQTNGAFLHNGLRQFSPNKFRFAAAPLLSVSITVKRYPEPPSNIRARKLVLRAAPLAAKETPGLIRLNRTCRAMRRLTDLRKLVSFRFRFGRSRRFFFFSREQTKASMPDRKSPCPDRCRRPTSDTFDFYCAVCSDHSG